MLRERLTGACFGIVWCACGGGGVPLFYFGLKTKAVLTKIYLQAECCKQVLHIIRDAAAQWHTFLHFLVFGLLLYDH